MPSTRRGSKNTALLEPRPEQGFVPGTVYVVARRPLTYNGVVIPVGVEVPDAASWRRVDAWVHARWIRAVAPDEEYTKYDDYLASLEAEEPSPPEE